MIDKTKLRYTVIIFLFLSLTALACAFTARENSTCLGVKIAKTPQPQNRQEIFVNLGDLFFLGDAKAAVSEAGKTIYISQNTDSSTAVRDLDGILSLADNSYSLEFAYDEMFDDLQKATAENHRFALFAVRGNEYVKYNVVFTTLPVVSVDGSVIGTNEDNREVFCGDMTVWEPVDRFSHSVRTQQSKVEYHFRGGTTYFEDKKALSFL